MPAQHLDALGALGARVVRDRHHGSKLDHRRLPGRLLRLLHDLHETPALVLGDRPRLHEADRVADPALVLLVVHLELRPAPHVASVLRVLDQALDGHDDRLVHAIADHLAHAGLAAIALRGHAFLPSFSRSTVSTRAISRRLSRILSGLSSCRMELRKRRLKSSSRSSVTRALRDRKSTRLN